MKKNSKFPLKGNDSSFPYSLDMLNDLLKEPSAQLAKGFAHLPPAVSKLDDASRKAAISVLRQVADRMTDNYPYFHPLYAGQMLKPPHPIAHAAYSLAMTINPNNHARDGGRASSQMEMEAVAEIAAMFGWQTHLGHLTSGGTFANLEGLWIAGQLAPGKRIVASDQAHYTHRRISAVLQLPFDSVRSDRQGRMDLNALDVELRKGDVGTVVATLGSTGLGAVDSLHEILSLRDRYGFRVHVDAAYGGYFRLIAETLDTPTRLAFQAIDQADSIVVDPHKHGLQPYGCGCVLFRDPIVGRLYKHDSPYTYFTSQELHLGEISLECSRAGASAVALWATQKLLPLTPGGEFARGLAASRQAAQDLHGRLRQDSRFATFSIPPELDIVVWKVNGPSDVESSRLAREVFEKCAELDLHLALVQLPRDLFTTGDSDNAGLPNSQLSVICLRSVLMKPEHENWLDAIWDRLDRSTQLPAS